MLYVVTHYGDPVATFASKRIASSSRRYLSRAHGLDYDALVVEEVPAGWC